jgi:Mor family transcriptional regulator
VYDTTRKKVCMNQSSQLNKNIIVAVIAIAAISFGGYLIYNSSKDDLAENKDPEKTKIEQESEVNDNNDTEKNKIVGTEKISEETEEAINESKTNKPVEETINEIVEAKKENVSQVFSSKQAKAILSGLNHHDFFIKSNIISDLGTLRKILESTPSDSMTEDIINKIEALIIKIVLGKNGSGKDLYIPEGLKERFTIAQLYGMFMLSDHDKELVDVFNAAKKDWINIAQKEFTNSDQFNKLLSQAIQSKEEFSTALEKEFILFINQFYQERGFFPMIKAVKAAERDSKI